MKSQLLDEVQVIDNTRRNFLKISGSMVALSVVGQLIPEETHSQKPVTLQNIIADEPVKLPPLDAATEAKKPDFFSPVQPDKRIGFAIVGLGQLTLEAIMPAFAQSRYAKPVALVSGDAAKAAKVAAQYGIEADSIYNYQNFDTIKNNAAVKVVYIVLPNGMHEEYTKRAAAAGKHVLCEKPMANTSAEAQRMVDACKKAAVKLMIAYRIQYEPHHRQVKEWVRNNRYGKTIMIDMFNGQNIGDPTQWRLNKKLAGGGALPDIGLYCLNTARYLTGEEPLWVNAVTYSTPGDERFKEVEESVLFQMQFPSGTLINAATSYGVHEARRYRVHGSAGGNIEMDPAFPYKGLQMKVNEVRDDKAWDAMPSIEAKDQFALELDHMAQCVMQNKQPYTPGEEGVQDMKLMEAIYQSAKDKKPVTLTSIDTKDTFRGEAPKQ